MKEYQDLSRRLFIFIGNDPYDPDIDWQGASIYLEDEMYDLYEGEMDSGDLAANHLIITSEDKSWEFVATMESWRKYLSDDVKRKYYGKVEGNKEEFTAWLTLMRLSLDF